MKSVKMYCKKCLGLTAGETLLVVTDDDKKELGEPIYEAGKPLLEMLGEGDGRMLAEFGIGTNDKARITGVVLEDEKVYGTIYVAFGSNNTFGGTVAAGVHIDGVVQKPVVRE